MITNFYSKNISNPSFGGLKPKNTTITKTVNQVKNKIDYSQFDPYFIKIFIDEGCSQKEIAHDLGISAKSVRSVLKHFGLKTQIAQLLSAIKDSELKQLLDAGKSQKEIAEHFMIDDVGALTQLIRKLGIHSITQTKVENISKDEIKQMLDAGMSIQKIADKFQVSAKYISEHISALGITKQEKTIPLERLKHCLFFLNMSIPEIAAKYEISVAKVSAMLKEHGLKTKKQEALEIIPTKNEILAKMAECKSVTELADKLGISPRRTKNFMEKYDIQPFHVVIKDPSEILGLLKKNPYLSVDEIAAKLDIPPASIDTAIRKFKIPVKKPIKMSQYYNAYELRNIFIRHFNIGDSTVQIGELYGISSKKVKDLIKRINEHYKNSPDYQVRMIKDKKSPTQEKLLESINKIAEMRIIKEDNKISYNSPESLLDKISEDLNISTNSVLYLTEKYGMSEILSKCMYPSKEEILNAIGQTDSDYWKIESKVRNKFNISSKDFYNLIEKYNL